MLSSASHRSAKTSKRAWLEETAQGEEEKKTSAFPLTTSRSLLILTCVCSLLLTAAIPQLEAAGALLSNAQYSQATCESSRLSRCQQDVVRDMQAVSLNSASVQFPLSGPPYSSSRLHSGQQQNFVNHTTCRLVRANLDCLLATTPACYELGIQAALNTDLILRAKRFLEQSGCNEPDTNWQSTFCYRSNEIRSCEERYGFTGYTSGSLERNLSSCLSYQGFKVCVDTNLRLNCKVHEMDMINEYLIDRASDLSWRCPANISSTYQLNSHYQLNNQPGNLLSPSVSSYNSLSAYDQRPIPSYVGSSTGNLNLFGSRDQAWERFRSPVDETRFGISRYPGGSNDVFERLVAANNFDVDSSDCPVKAAPYARECEDTLMEQQRLARDSRDGNELSRRICCSLFQYRDCISRVVLDRCADSTPVAVEMLMGVRRREMTLTCRGFNRDICSGALANATLNLHLLVVVAVLTSFMTLKQSLHSFIIGNASS